MEIKQVCPKCFGEGEYHKTTTNGDVVIDPCTQCGGDGYFIVLDADDKKITASLARMEKKIDAILKRLPE